LFYAVTPEAAMNYDFTAIPDAAVPKSTSRMLQHLLDIYASETNKVVSTWNEFKSLDLDFRPHPKSSSVREIMKHQLLSERRFFGEFLGTPEPVADQVLPPSLEVDTCCARLVELATVRLDFFAKQSEPWWLEVVPFFDVRRERIWVFWRRVLHTSHHRTQLTVYLRLLEHKVPSTYGPTADVTWKGADPTNSVDAAGRR
jgi:uncharacterized damage-inducible protein DinB